MAAQVSGKLKMVRYAVHPWKMGVLPVTCKELWRRRKRIILTLVACLHRLAMLSGAAGCMTSGNPPPTSALDARTKWGLTARWLPVVGLILHHQTWCWPLVLAVSLYCIIFTYWSQLSFLINSVRLQSKWTCGSFRSQPSWVILKKNPVK